MTTNETLKTLKDFTDKGMERMTSLGEMNLSAFDRVAHKQMNVLEMMMEHGNRALTLASTAKGYNEFLKGQIETAKDLGEQVVSVTKAHLDLTARIGEDYSAWYRKNMADIRADVRKAIPGV